MSAPRPKFKLLIPEDRVKTMIEVARMEGFMEAVSAIIEDLKTAISELSATNTNGLDDSRIDAIEQVVEDLESFALRHAKKLAANGGSLKVLEEERRIAEAIDDLKKFSGLEDDDAFTDR